MKRALKKKSNIYAYLDSTKVLETGTDEAIMQAKKAYWSAYKVSWRKGQRKATEQFTIAFSPAEAKQIAISAKMHRRSKTRFIREACLAYINKIFLTPDRIALGSIRQALALNYNALQNLFNENIVPYQAGQMLMQQMAELEQTVHQQLHYPKTIEQTIEDTIKANPGYKDTLIHLLQNMQL